MDKQRRDQILECPCMTTGQHPADRARQRLTAGPHVNISGIRRSQEKRLQATDEPLLQKKNIKIRPKNQRRYNQKDEQRACNETEDKPLLFYEKIEDKRGQSHIYGQS